MDQNYGQPDRRTRLPGYEPATNERPVGVPRESGLKRVRRLSNWTLAALMIGVGATTAGLARTIPTGTTSTVTAGHTGSGGLSSVTGHQSAPAVNSPVATTSASGVVIANTGTSSTGARSWVRPRPHRETGDVRDGELTDASFGLEADRRG